MPLARTLGFKEVFCLAAGAMISSGLFVLPGLAYSRDSERINYDGLPVTSLNSGAGMKLTFTHLSSKKIKTRFGADINRGWYSQTVEGDSSIHMEVNDLQASLFLEADWKISKKLDISPFAKYLRHFLLSASKGNFAYTEFRSDTSS